MCVRVSWFNFFLGLNYIFLCFKLVIIHYLNQKQKKIKFKPRIKLNHNTYAHTNLIHLYHNSQQRRHSAVLSMNVTSRK